MARESKRPLLDVVDMLRDEYERIHGPFDATYREWDERLRKLEKEPAGGQPLDQRLRAFYAQVHALGASADDGDGTERSAQKERAGHDGTVRALVQPDELRTAEGGRSALCLSGGGIRSASFCLGVLQALAGAGVLHRFHYLSTVSGGGYIGSWFTAWIHRHFSESRERTRKRAEPLRQSSGSSAVATGAEREQRSDLLEGVSQLLATGPGAGGGAAGESGRQSSRAQPSRGAGIFDSGAGLGGDRPPEPAQVAHLRRFTNYLSPHTGMFSLDTWTLVAVYVRNLVLNWLVILPLLGGTLVVPHIVASLFAPEIAPSVVPGLSTALVPVLAALGISSPDASFLAGGLVLSVVAAVLLALAVIVSVLLARTRSVGVTEDLSRVEGGLLGFAVGWAAFVALAFYGPHLLRQTPRLIAALGGASGIGTFLFKKLGDRIASRDAGASPSKKMVRAATTAAAVLTILLILMALALGVEAAIDWTKGSLQGRWPDRSPEAIGIWATLAVGSSALAFSAVAALFIDINEFSLHALYRNRLVRAFLRASKGEDARKDDKHFDETDDLALAKLWPADPPSPADRVRNAPRLFHVINATLNDLRGTRPEWNERKAVSFTFSPLHYGAHIAGRYQEKRGAERGGYRALRPATVERENDPLRLGTAMTISGAAVNPNMGYHSSAMVTFLMALFNVRLGWWLRSPWHKRPSSRLPATPATAWRAWMGEALGNTRFDSSVINVSDGGHFDNLGLYEMVRRRCRYIVVVDAGQDRGYDFESLGEVLRKVRIDFGISITLTGLDLSGSEAGTRATTAPVSHVWHGTIHYSRVDDMLDRTPRPGATQRDPVLGPAPDGELIYIKPILSGDEAVDVQAYRRFHGAFPHEPTADQWFGESQFESYRRLGEHSVSHLLDYYEASKGEPRPLRTGAIEAAGARPTGSAITRGHGGAGGLSPELFSHRVAESLSLMKRHRDSSTHAGGVVYRKRSNGDVAFFLVKSIDHLHRVLPKGHIEPGEAPARTAAREVREETGFSLEPDRSLGVFGFETATRKVTTAYYLMQEAVGDPSNEPLEDFRDPDWFTIAEAGHADLPVPADVIDVLRRAHEAIVGEGPAVAARGFASHGGGVVYRRGKGGSVEFLLVKSTEQTYRVLPKGHIEASEDAHAAAVREVREESGLEPNAGRSLGVFTYTKKVPVSTEYFLMTVAGRASTPGEKNRDPRWFTIEAARRTDLPVPEDVIDILEAASAVLGRSADTRD